MPTDLATSPTQHAAISAEVAEIAKAPGGVVGVHARHLESDLVVSLNADERFPLASTYKLPIAGYVLSQVDAGVFPIDHMVALDHEIVVPSEGIAKLFPYPGVSLSVGNLIDSMLTHSDNTATDMLLELAGGGGPITDWVSSLGFPEVRIDDSTADIVRRFYDLGPGAITPQLDLVEAADPARGRTSNPNFNSDPRNTGTPRAMAGIVEKLTRGGLFSPPSHALLISALERNATGHARLRAQLPVGARLGNKTGTIGGTMNDVGLITLPNGAGHIAIAVYIKGAKRPVSDRETTIAKIGRAVCDYVTEAG